MENFSILFVSRLASFWKVQLSSFWLIVGVGYEEQLTTTKCFPFSSDLYLTTKQLRFQSALQTTASKNPDALPILYSALPTVFHGYDSLFFKAIVKDDLFEGTQICNTDNIANNKESKFAVSAVCSQMRIVARTGKSTRFGEKSLLFAYFSDVSILGSNCFGHFLWYRI